MTLACRRRSARLALLFAGLAAVACRTEGGAGGRSDTDLSGPDSLATAREIQASLAGQPASGRHFYSYRRLQAGLTRAALESRLARIVADSTTCGPSDTVHGEISCSYLATLGEDDAPVRVKALYGPGATPDRRRVREIIVERALPLDVDGVTVARALADAFERQTTLLDRREATYGHHQARIRVGTVGGSPASYAQIVVEQKQGREVLTVTTGQAAAPATPAPR